MTSVDTEQENRDALIIVIAGSIVIALAFGVRAVFGGFVEPISQDLFGGSIEIFSLAIAIQNLVWGVAQPVFGVIADKYGDRMALWLGFTSYVLGMAICVLGTTETSQYMGAGILVGMGISGTTFGTVLAVIGRAAPPEKRGLYLGIASAMGSVGQATLPLLVSWLIAWLNWQTVLTIVTGFLVPMVLCIPLLHAKRPTNVKEVEDLTELNLRQTIKNAFGHRSFVMLSLGFFVCGFHLAFITAHLPNYVQNFCFGTNLSPEELRAVGLRALALAGLANIFGTLLAARLGEIFPKPYVLATIYLLRTLIIAWFVIQPISPNTVMVFGLLMGGLWLSTVPLTSGLVLIMFGPRAMGTLFGFVFLSHQLGGFVGVWLGGIWFDRFGSYDSVWFIAGGLGLVSAVIHLTVHEKPVLAET